MVGMGLQKPDIIDFVRNRGPILLSIAKSRHSCPLYYAVALLKPVTRNHNRQAGASYISV